MPAKHFCFQPTFSFHFLIPCKHSLRPTSIQTRANHPILQHSVLLHPQSHTISISNLYNSKSHTKIQVGLMDTNVIDVVAEDEEAQQRQPLLDRKSKTSATISNQDDQQTLVQKAISQTFQSTAHLANLLPTGTVLAFQLLSPIFTNKGQCDTVSRHMTTGLIGLCALSCFVLCFTDSFKDSSGKVRYVVATRKDFWVIDGGDEPGLAQEEGAKYRLKFIDFFHALLSILVFAAVALFDENVVNCFYPEPSKETEEMLTALPVAIGVFCSMLFVVFPTERHGIGFPLTYS